MAYCLSVTKTFAFDGKMYERGQHVTDAAEVAKIKASEYAQSVRGMILPDSELPAKIAPKGPKAIPAPIVAEATADTPASVTPAK
jgi:hypothetical protein